MGAAGVMNVQNITAKEALLLHPAGVLELCCTRAVYVVKHAMRQTYEVPYVDADREQSTTCKQTVPPHYKCAQTPQRRIYLQQSQSSKCKHWGNTKKDNRKGSRDRGRSQRSGKQAHH